MAEAEGITIGTVIVDDDVAVKDSTWTVGRRGVAGNFFVIKAIGAASEKGAELEDLVALGERVNSVTRTMGMALTSCTPPAKGSPLFELGDDEMEMGVGIHGEPGRRREKLADANAIVDELVEATASDLPFSKGDNVALMINGLGGTPISELYLLYGRAHDQLVVARDQRRPQLRRRVLHVARHGGLLGDAREARRRAHLAARGTGGGGRSHLLTTGLTARTRLGDHRAMVDEVSVRAGPALAGPRACSTPWATTSSSIWKNGSRSTSSCPTKRGTPSTPIPTDGSS